MLRRATTGKLEHIDWWISGGMNSCQCFIFFTLLQLTLGVQTTLKKGQTFTFPLPEGASINEIEWKRHISNETKVLARIFLNNGKKYDSKIYSKRTGMHIMENGTLHMEDINNEDSGNYSCTIVFDNQRTQELQIYLQVLPDFLPTQGPKQHRPVHNSTKPAEPLVPTITLLIVIPVCSALALIFVIVVTIIIFRCGKKYCSTSEEPIYINKEVVHKSRK